MRGHVLGLERRSGSHQSPGSTMTGVTPPSSLDIGIVDLGIVGSLAPCGVGPGAVDDGVVRGGAAGDVDGRDERVARQVGAHVGPAVGECQEASGDELGEGGV